MSFFLIVIYLATYDQALHNTKRGWRMESDQSGEMSSEFWNLIMDEETTEWWKQLILKQNLITT